MDNKKDLNKILDKNEKFKYLFPFYRMDIDIFELKLLQIGGVQSGEYQTEFVRISDLKQAFCGTPAWQEDWSKVEALLRLPEFKLLMNEEKENLRGKIGYGQEVEYLSKLELGVLALLWCHGSQS